MRNYLLFITGLVLYTGGMFSLGYDIGKYNQRKEDSKLMKEVKENLETVIKHYKEKGDKKHE